MDTKKLDVKVQCFWLFMMQYYCQLACLDGGSTYLEVITSNRKHWF